MWAGDPESSNAGPASMTLRQMSRVNSSSKGRTAKNSSRAVRLILASSAVNPSSSGSGRALEREEGEAGAVRCKSQQGFVPTKSMNLRSKTQAARRWVRLGQARVMARSSCKMNPSEEMVRRLRREKEAATRSPN
uniref:Uncharacterized protein n=1 Tax=Nelumbo nucifera TaxID=4432 RepID=A0A822Z5A9_NELNU|nr:TPA_asm: hypothetical protein HUJ06_014350 [Nelumbo nucifera]